jgi:hypothetical protein
MAQAEIKVEVKATWVKDVSIFVCRYIKSKWLLRQLCKLTVAKIYCNGKLSKKVTLGEYLPSF